MVVHVSAELQKLPDRINVEPSVHFKRLCASHDTVMLW